MSDEVIHVAHDNQIMRLVQLHEQAQDFAEHATAERSAHEQAQDWKRFELWCASEHLTALPALPETVASFAADVAANGFTLGQGKQKGKGRPYKPATVVRHLASVAMVHRRAGFDSPCDSTTVKDTTRGIKRKKAKDGVRREKKAAALADTVKAMVAECDRTTLAGIRDAALMLVGFAGAFRRSELAGLNREDIVIDSDGMLIRLRRSKTDQEGDGIDKWIQRGQNGTCPVKVLEQWIEQAGIQSGPLFRAVDRHGKPRQNGLCDRTVAEVVKKLAKAANLDPAQFSGHSLRRGHAQEATRGGATVKQIMDHVGWQSERTAHGYMDDANVKNRSTSGKIGL